MSSGDFDFNVPPPASSGGSKGGSGRKPTAATKPKSAPKPAAKSTTAVKPNTPSTKPKAVPARSSAWLIGGIVAALAIVGSMVAVLVFVLNADFDGTAKDSKSQVKGAKKSEAGKKQDSTALADAKKAEAPPPPVAIPRTLAELRRLKEMAANDPPKTETVAKAPAEPEKIKPAVGTSDEKAPAKTNAGDAKKKTEKPTPKVDKSGTKPAPKGPEPAWKVEIFKEIQSVRATIDEKNGAMNAKLDKMEEAERKDALDALQFLTERYEKASPDEEEAVAKFAPHIVQLYQREMSMRSGTYAKQVKAKEAPDRLSAADRKKKHGELMEVLKQKEKWTLAVPFDDLSATEMAKAVETARKAEKAGVQALTKEERTLLLRAGARDYFQRKLSDAK